jgi:hypothetical protein
LKGQFRARQAAGKGFASPCGTRAESRYNSLKKFIKRAGGDFSPAALFGAIVAKIEN